MFCIQKVSSQAQVLPSLGTTEKGPCLTLCRAETRLSAEHKVTWTKGLTWHKAAAFVLQRTENKWWFVYQHTNVYLTSPHHTKVY